MHARCAVRAVPSGCAHAPGRIPYAAAVRAAACLVLLAAAAGAAGADQGSQAVEPEQASVSPQQLLLQLPSGVAAIVTHGDGVWWTDGKGVEVQFAPVVFNDPAVLATAVGPIALRVALLKQNRVDVLEALPALVAQAKGAGLKGADLSLEDSILVGPHLRSSTTLVLREGVLSNATVKVVDRSGDLAILKQQAAVCATALASGPANSRARGACVDLLGRLSWGEDRAPLGDEASGAFARALVRAGWLSECGAFSGLDAGAGARLAGAIDQAEGLQRVIAYQGGSGKDALVVAEVRDAFGAGGWILTTPARVSYTRTAPRPAFHWDPPELSLVVDLPVGADPLAAPAHAIAARLYDHDGARVASWSERDGFSADADSWRAFMPARGKAQGKNVVADFVPPAIPLGDLRGRMSALLGPAGVLALPHAGSPAEVERFEAQAAQLLPDASHLDLIGEFAFAYLHPSPDGRFPLIIGTRQSGGDLQQTDAELIARSSGGVMHGDLGDLAELYQVVASRQGRLAHVLRLPTTPACVWTERKDDGRWHAFVLQCGPAYEFIDKDPPSALEHAARAFSDCEVFDRDALAVLLRFSGEGTRTPCAMSWRVFAEPEYARAIADIQGDIHLATYQRGIRAVQKLLSDQDLDVANLRLFAALEADTGQYAAAAKTLQGINEGAADPVSCLDISLERVRDLIDSGQLKEARELAGYLLDHQLGARDPPAHLLSERLGLAKVRFGADFVEVLTHRDAQLADLAESAVQSCMLGQMTRSISELGDWLDSPDYNQQAWNELERFQDLRRLSRAFAASAVRVLTCAPHDDLLNDAILREIASTVGIWFNQVAFHDAAGNADYCERYAAAGAYYEAMFGEDIFAHMLQDKPAAPPTVVDPAKRVGGPGQVTFDLPWIDISVPYWYRKMARQLAGDHPRPDPQAIANFARHLEDAYFASGRLGIDDARIDHDRHLGRLMAAVMASNVAIVKERMQEVVVRNDKRLRDDTADLLGRLGAVVPLPWYREVIAMWHDQVHYKPRYFAIAWRAALSGAPEAALAVADLAATAFKDDPAFAEEADYMRKLLEASGAATQP